MEKKTDTIMMMIHDDGYPAKKHQDPLICLFVNNDKLGILPPDKNPPWQKNSHDNDDDNEDGNLDL